MARDISPGLPDGLFSNRKSQFGSNLEGLRLELCLHNLWPFGIFYRELGYFMVI
jgi:hypothetical protein